MNTQGIKEISSVSFGVFSPEEIIKISVCDITSPKKTGYNTVYDPRMGTTDSSKPCETCGENANVCPGHFGHIELHKPVVHPLMYKKVLGYLNCFCVKCNRLLLTKDQIFLYGFNRYKGHVRYGKIKEKIKKVEICCHEDCATAQPKFRFLPTECVYTKTYEGGRHGEKVSVTLTVPEIQKTFNNISDEDVKLLGFDPELIHPRNLIISVLPVLPHCDRPFVRADGNICDDDLTNQYIEIVKINNHLKPYDEEVDDKPKEISESKRQKLIASLRFRIFTTFNNSQGKAKHTTNGRPIKGIKERLAGKDGQIRNNMMGKRSLKVGTPIWDWNGNMKKVEEIKVGDVVIGDDGLPRTVLDTLTGRSPLYKIKQSRGEDYVVSCEHILTLKFCGHAKIYWRKNQGKRGGWFMKWYDRPTKKVNSVKVSLTKDLTKEEAKSRIDALRERINLDPIIDIHVKDYLTLSDTDKRLMLGVKLNVPVMWRERPTPLDPRILGMWLGDGSKNRSVFTNEDKPLNDYFRNWCEEMGGEFTDWSDGLHHGITGCNFTQILKNNNLYDDKHIPEEYIVNSPETRLKLLAGIVDTDGSVEQDGKTLRITQCKSHEKIIQGLEKICNSLGFRTSVAVKKTSWTNKCDKKRGEALVLTVSGKLSRIPTLLPRKKLCDSSIDASVTGIEVVEDGIGDFCGFEVDGNNRFILGKDATITHNCNQTGRTVIGPDPTLKLGELAVPKEMAEILTVPVKVTDFNFHTLQKIVNDGDAHSILKANGSIRINLDRYRRGTRLVGGDIIHRNGEKIPVVTGRELIVSGDKIERDGVILDKIISSGRSYPIQKGWVVERKLRDDDYVLLNRQPTLHKASMLAMKVKIKPGKTLRFNLAATKPFNADFDGDEMNIHVPQTLESQAELKYLSAAQWNIISPQSSKPNMAIVQDSLVGSYRMTKGIKKITRDQFFDIINKLELDFNPLDRIYHIRRILKSKGKKIQCYTGKGLISMILPKDLIYEKHNDGDENEPVIKIYRGVLYEGTLNKSIIGSAHNSLIQIIHKEYGAERASQFIDHIQFVANNWLLIEGFTVGLGDCLVRDPKKEQEIQDVIKKCYIEADGLKDTTNHPVILEMRINAALNKAKDIGLKIAKDALDKNNNFLSTVNSGSKGDFFNIAQITGLLGQQNLKGKRVPLFLNNGKRSLPHYPFGKLQPKEEYESRGFIASSFIKGLNPREFYFHAMSGREGICDTAMGTATSGYMQRRIVKLTEDIKVQYDGTIRDVPGHIYQLAYGENSLDSTSTVKVKGRQEFCDVSRLVAKLNMKYELQKKKKKKSHR
jgi:DNA-directed RNA polymerase beta' subunit